MLYQLATLDWRDASKFLRVHSVDPGRIDEADVRQIREAAYLTKNLGLEAVGKVFPLGDACYQAVELVLNEARINVRIAELQMDEAHFAELIKQNLHAISDDMFLAAATKLSEFSPMVADKRASLFPPPEQISEISKKIAVEVAKHAGVLEHNAELRVAHAFWEPHYPLFINK